MPTEAYEVIVSQNGAQSEHNAVANAASYLAYADTTDSVGYMGNIFDVNVYDGEDGMDYGIGLCVSFPVSSPEDVKRFESEMEQLEKVETFTGVYFNPIDE